MMNEDGGVRNSTGRNVGGGDEYLPCQVSRLLNVRVCVCVCEAIPFLINLMFCQQSVAC